jgi:uracil-DNA glycosylase
MQHRVFINYRRQDSEGYVGRLYDHLTRYFEPDDLFMDIDNIKPGADFVKMLEDAVAACDVLLAVIGPQWTNCVDDTGARRLEQWNDFVRIEIASALRLEKMVIPVLVGKAGMPSPKELPDDLAGLTRRNAIELSHQRFAYDVEKLVNAIKSYIPPNASIKPRADSGTIQRKAAEIKAIKLELINAVDSPLYSIRTQHGYLPVIGDGSPDANILFIGESPGKNEAEQGIPFIGQSGMVLNEMLAGIGLKREDVYITNLLLDSPVEKREPTQEELAFYTPIVDRLIDIIQPAVIATLGRFAMEYVLKKLDLPEKRGKISQLHGKLIKAQMAYGDIHVIPLYHPAVVLYSASQKETLRKDFQKLKLFV